MDDQTLARFKASGEKDLATFLAKQGAQNDLPPGVSGYSGGAQNFAGTTAAEKAANTPSYADRIEAGFARLSGIPAALRSAGQTLGIVAPDNPAGNVLNAANRQGNLEAGLDNLEARSTTLQTPGERALAAATKTEEGTRATKVLNAFVTGKPLLTPEEEAKKKETDRILNSRAIGQNVLTNASRLRSLGPDDILSTLNPR